MQQQHSFILNIILADGGSDARSVIELYGNQISADIDQTAWNMCDCDNKVQSEKFCNLVLEQWSVSHRRDGDFNVKASFTVNSQEIDFIDKVIEEYMDGFADSIAVTLNGYYSRTGERVGLNAHPLNWDVEIK